MEIGKLNQKASPLLVWFVLSICFVVAFLLYVTQKSENVAYNIYSTSDKYTSLTE